MAAPTPFARQLHPAFLRDVDSGAAVSSNERDLLDLVRRHGTTTRADLVRATGLTAQSVMRLVDELVERGMLELGETRSQGRGKPAATVTLVPDYAHAIGVSITTDSIALGLMDFAGNLLGQHQEPMRATGRGALLRRIRTLAERLLHKSEVDEDSVFGVGLGMTGFFIGEGSKVNPPEPLDGLALLEVDTLLADAMGHPVWLDNDGSVAAIGESLHGVGHRYRDFAYFYFGHGFGGGLIMDGRCSRGAHGNAGEFAGMLPALGLERAALETLRSMLVKDGEDLPDIQALVEQYDPAWPAIERWIERVAPGLSVIASAVVAIVDPQAIVLGGRIPPDLAQRLIPRIAIDNVSRRGHARPQPAIVTAQAPFDAVALGAASLPFKECFFH
ncbi:ROK family transcriptional regulator [Dyella marensis]|uniref:Sugar kinase of the NBD/HSP70 family, may contain an N-terminal HTH domain n=1 Tax=Dyella marensis TaxID=500610 RepID=A0A1I1ZIY6_9GAMM|nr:MULTISPECIES: ROK family transcriptional regulator [Dyella]SFE31671.1 Sugar kinase of the NBD/HSP70 family, may contain an N-terminal HTH domain [Dyella marensis]